MSDSSYSTSSRPVKRAENNGKRKEWETGEPSSKKIVVNIHGPDGIVNTFRTLRNLPIQNLLKNYCDDQKLEYLATDFLDADGKRVRRRSTPDELGMVDGDQIDALVRVDGGGGGHWTI